MLFSSMTFIFMFLPAVIGLYFIANDKIRNYILLIASIFFYSWGEPKYAFLMLGIILVNWVGALLIEKYQHKKKYILIAALAVNLGLLFYFKYFNFVLNGINAVFDADIPFLETILPIGISFYTFQAISYIIDVYRGTTKAQKNFSKLALYISLFPQLVAGPIIKYHDIAPQIDNRSITTNNVVYGVRRFIIGLAKKVLLANTMGGVADTIFALAPEDMGVTGAWIGAITYSLQLFFDFSGYSDMAIGLGQIFGFKFLENFNYPYIAKSITDFWRRWHMSLSTWFREYLYIPLGGNRISLKRTCINLFIVFLATGIWHGAAWTFVVWGLWHGLFMIIEKITGIHKHSYNWKLRTFQHLYTILVFIIGWVIFRSDNISHAIQYIMVMFGITESLRTYDIWFVLGNFEIIAMIIALLCTTPMFRNLLKQKNNTIKNVLLNYYMLFLFIVSAMSVAASTYNPFLYFRF